MDYGAMALFLAPYALSLLAALVVRRWWALIVPLVTAPLYYAGLRYGWWGDGVGDGWPWVVGLITALAVAGAAVVIGAWGLLARQQP
jgi:hypothetical protein